MKHNGSTARRQPVETKDLVIGDGVALPARQALSGTGSPGDVDLVRFQGDDALFDALVAGAHVENAAAFAGVSSRTAYRRMADPVFRQRVESAREAIRDSILTRLSEAAGDAVSRLWELVNNEEPEIQLKAAKTLLDSLVKVQSITPKTTTTVRYAVEQVQSE